MKELVNWLIGMEKLAYRVYDKAASKFSDDREFADFLRHLGKEENDHYNLAKKAAELTENKYDLPSIVSINEKMKQDIEHYLLFAVKRIEAGGFTKENMVDCIVTTESSEWNTLFMFVAKTLAHNFREFIPYAANIQHHIKSIELFLESHEEYSDYFERLKGLPKTWWEKILIVDDDESIRDLVESILITEGSIDKAPNGKEALRKIGEKYYAAIISDVDMPVMNGIEFYNKSVRLYPGIKDRFLFFTGLADEHQLSFFKENNLIYLVKPSPINDIKKAVIDILNK